MVVAVAGGPPGRDAVDQLAPVGQHDAAALGARDRQRRPRGLHLRIGQPDMGEPRRVPVGRAARLGFYLVGGASIPRRLQSFWLARRHGHSTPAARNLSAAGSHEDMRSLDEFAAAKLAELERASLRRRLVDTTRLDGIWALRNGRRLLSFSCNDYLNLTQHPAVKAAAIEALQQLRRRQRRLAAGHRQSSAVRRARGAARPPEGDRGRLRVRLRLSRQYRHHSGPDRRRRSGADRRAGPCLPVGRRAARRAPP